MQKSKILWTNSKSSRMGLKQTMRSIERSSGSSWTERNGLHFDMMDGSVTQQKITRSSSHSCQSPSPSDRISSSVVGWWSHKIKLAMLAWSETDNHDQSGNLSRWDHLLFKIISDRRSKTINTAFPAVLDPLDVTMSIAAGPRPHQASSRL